MINESGALKHIEEKLKAYKKRFFLNLLYRGLLIFLGLGVSCFLLLAILEYFFYLTPTAKTIFFFSFIVLVTGLLIWQVFLPLTRFLGHEKSLDDETAARNIGSHFPDIKDKLLNIIQLYKSAGVSTDLVEAAVKQRSGELKATDFTQSINYKSTKKYFKYALIPLALACIIILFVPTWISESTPRLIQYDKAFSPQAPFDFHISSQPLQTFKNENFELTVGISGEYVPKEAFIHYNGRKIKLQEVKQGSFKHSFSKLQENEQFQIEAAGFFSDAYELQVDERPLLRSFSVSLQYPAYTDKASDQLNNIGNLEIPEGTHITWLFDTKKTDSLKLKLGNNQTYSPENIDNQVFKFEKSIKQSTDYSLMLQNAYSQNKNPIRYHINVIPDEAPLLDVNTFGDTVNYNYIVVAGSVADDYGISNLSIHYKTIPPEGKAPESYQSLHIPINKNQQEQSYYYQWQLDSSQKQLGTRIEYFVQASDNDQVNGAKSTRSSYFSFTIPGKEKLQEEIEKSAEKTGGNIEKSVQKTEKLSEQVEEVSERLKGKKELSWQDKKMVEDLMKKRKDLEKDVKQLQEQFKDELSKRDRLDQQKNSTLKKKSDELNKLMSELMDEETKKLYDELKKLMEERSQSEDIQKSLDKIQHKEKNLEQELDRTLSLFKRMKMEFQLNQTINDLNELSKEQEKLAQESEKEEQAENNKLAEQQKQLEEKFEDIKKDMEGVRKTNQELKQPQSLPDISFEEDYISEQMQKSQESLQEGKPKESSQNQKNAAQEMKSMSSRLSQMIQGMNTEMISENIDHLRDILDNLIKLSYDQEEVMKEFRKVNQRDPRFVDLSQQQLQLKDNAQIIEDSLLSLAERVFMIRSFVTREVSEMNRQMDKSMEAIRERNKSQAASRQQFAMSSMNNLALLLSDVLKQMQMQMMSSMGMGQQKQQSNSPSLSKLQQQLNQQISELKKSGKSGQELSEELAKMAAKQEEIRRALKQEQDSGKPGEQGSKGKLGEIMKKMEETEEDLVNKNISQQTIERQREILTRLLEAEKSMRERDLSKEREAEQAKKRLENMPKAFEEYIKLKEQELELLKTVPVKLNNYYKNEVSEYFKRINN